MRGRIVGMDTNNSIDREAWRQRPWAIVLLILLAVAFSGELVLGAAPLAIIGSGLLLLGWTAQLVLSVRRNHK